MSYSKFKETLNKHLKYETAAQQHILKYYNDRTPDDVYTLHEVNEDCLYDFSIKSSKYKYKFEVKADLMSNHTNNYYIEYESSGKPSGILTSKADYYVITNGKNYYCIKLSKLKDIYEQNLKIPSMHRECYEKDDEGKSLHGNTGKPRYTNGLIIKTNMLNHEMVLINSTSDTNET